MVVMQNGGDFVDVVLLYMSGKATSSMGVKSKPLSLFGKLNSILWMVLWLFFAP
jgi:hypothetical protein